MLAATCPGAAGQAAGVAAPAEIGRAAERGELLTHGAAAVLACGASGGVLLCALRGKETKRERP